MTTHDRDKVIAAAKEAGIDLDGINQSLPLYVATQEEMNRFYAIAHEDGRQGDKADAERYRWLCEIGQSLLHPAFATRNITSWKTKAEIDTDIDRARGDTK